MRANDALLIDSVELARAYLDRWEETKNNCCPNRGRPGMEAGPTLMRIGETAVTLWGSPTRNNADLHDVSRLIRGAREGVLFVMTQGKKLPVVLSEMLNLGREGLFLQGIVASRDPRTRMETVLYDSLREGPTVLSDAPRIDSNIILVDPFGPHPVLITGSLCPGAGARTKSNLLIIENANGLAAEYAVYAFHQFQRLRFLAMVKRISKSSAWLGLTTCDSWQEPYFKKGRRTLDFLFGLIAPGDSSSLN